MPPIIGSYLPSTYLVEPLNHNLNSSQPVLNQFPTSFGLVPNKLPTSLQPVPNYFPSNSQPVPNSLGWNLRSNLALNEGGGDVERAGNFHFPDLILFVVVRRTHVVAKGVDVPVVESFYIVTTPPWFTAKRPNFFCTSMEDLPVCPAPLHSAVTFSITQNETLHSA
jgi:hypothetical protein